MKIALIIAAILLAVGILIAAVGAISFFSKKPSPLAATTHTIGESFSHLTINTDTADVTLALAEDGVCRVVCRESDALKKHAVKVEEGTLSIELQNMKKWYHYLIPNFAPGSDVTIYLPQSTLDSLSISLSTGDVTVPVGLTFDHAAIKHSTGNVYFDATVQNDLLINGNTGDTTLDNGASVGGCLEITQTTGCANVTLDGESREIKITTDTGDITLKDASAQKIALKASTGDVTLMSVDASDIAVTTSTGDVKGTLRSEKIFTSKTDTGKINVPQTTNGGKCNVETSTGDVHITIE